MMHEMLSHIQGIYENRVKGPKMSNQIEILLEGVRSKQYQPLMTRTRCGKLTKLQHQFDIFFVKVFLFCLLVESLENRISHFAKKRRIEISKRDDDDDEE